MRTPFEPPPLRPAPDPDEWAAYERASDRAHRQYIAMPTALAGGMTVTLCRVCRDNLTRFDVCVACRRKS